MDRAGLYHHSTNRKLEWKEANGGLELSNPAFTTSASGALGDTVGPGFYRQEGRSGPSPRMGSPPRDGGENSWGHILMQAHQIFTSQTIQPCDASEHVGLHQLPSAPASKANCQG